MFKCQKCSKTAERPNRIVIERKMVTHKDGTQGSQIVKEINVCPDCIATTPEVPKPQKIVFEKLPDENLDTSDAA